MSFSQTGHEPVSAGEGLEPAPLVLRVAAVELVCVVHKPVVWGNFPPSVIHGMLGMAWRRGLCPKPSHQPCATCDLLPLCSYGKYFAGCIPAGEPRANTRGVNQLAAVRLFLDRWQDQFLDVGALFHLQLWCYGSATEKAPLILANLFHAMAHPIGRASKSGQRGEVHIAAARDLIAGTTWHEPGQKGTALPELKVRPLSLGFLSTLADEAENSAVEGPWRLTTLSPLRLEEHGRAVRELTPRALTTATLRRLSGLAQIHEGIILETPHRQLSELAARWPYNAAAKHYTLRRYSARQGQRIDMPGLQGYLDIPALPRAWKHLFSLAAIIGVGKATSMGFGALRLDRFENSDVA